MATPNAWEEVKRKGEASIKRWIDDNMYGKSCVIILVGSETANRPWVRYEIGKGWNDGRGVLGIRIDKLLGTDGKPSTRGIDPFTRIKLANDRSLDSYVSLKSPGGLDSKAAYASIANNIEAWIEEAIKVRAAA